MHRAPRCWLCCLVSSFLLFTLLGIIRGAEPKSEQADMSRVYVGTYTRGSDSQGIYSLKLNTRTGEMTDPHPVGKAVNPSFLAIHPNHETLYAVSEIEQLDGKPTGGVTAFRIDPKTGDLTKLNAQSSGSAGPCYVTIDDAGKVLLVANYGGGSVAALPIAADGQLQSAASVIQHTGKSIDPKRQEGPHAHSFVFGVDQSRAYAPDLGLDQIRIYEVDIDHGQLKPSTPDHAAVAPGSGPRHFDVHPNGKFAYVINELASTVTAFAVNPETGELTTLQTVSSLPEGDHPVNYTADLHVHPNGKFLYGSNRGHDSIVVYAIDADSGRLTPVQHESTRGETPRNFGIDPTGRILLAENQNSNTIYSFTIDAQTGKLTPTGYYVDVPKPVCVRFLPWKN
ncbi:MAG: lactonase family protein [Planctomycetaceae bacterium]